MSCSVSSVISRVSFLVNGPTSSFHISGGSPLVPGRQETLAIVNFSKVSARIESILQFSLNYFILLVPGETLIYYWTKIFRLAYPFNFIFVKFDVTNFRDLVNCLLLPRSMYSHLATLMLSFVSLGTKPLL